MPETNVYKANRFAGVGEFCYVLNGVWKDDKQESSVKLRNIVHIRQAFWTINSIGGLELLWECADGKHERIITMAGNGRFDIQYLELKPNNQTATGGVILNTCGFNLNDTYSIILVTKEKVSA